MSQAQQLLVLLLKQSWHHSAVSDVKREAPGGQNAFTKCFLPGEMHWLPCP